MATVTKGRTFVSGETVTPAKLNELVDLATVTSIVDADVSASAAIAGTKISPNFGSQNIVGGSVLQLANSANIVPSGTTAGINIFGRSTGYPNGGGIVFRGNTGGAGGVTSDGLEVYAGGSEQLRVDTSGIRIASALMPPPSGSAPIYGCRAWVNFDGTKDTTGAASTANTNRLIRASGNVTSVTRNQQGVYTVNLTTAMPDANYATHATGSNSGADGRQAHVEYDLASGQTASSVAVSTSDGTGTRRDVAVVSVAIFG